MNKTKAKKNRNAKRAVKSMRSAVDTQPKISVERAASVSMRDGAEEGQKVFRAVLSTENKVLELDGNRLVERILLMDGINNMPSQLPIFDQHNPSSALHRLGSIRDIQVSGQNLEGDLDFADTDDGRNAHSLYRDGHLTDVSIGAVFMRSDMKEVKAGKRVGFMGRAFEAHPNIPLQIVTRWTPVEVSAVNRGADNAAKVKRMFEELTAGKSETGRKGIDMDFSKWLERQEVDIESLTDEQRSGWEKLYNAEMKDKKEEKKEEKAERKEIDISGYVSKAVSEAIKAERKAESERVEAIRKAGEGIDQAIVDDCISRGLSLDDSRAKFLIAMQDQRKKAGIPFVNTLDGGKITREHIEASYLMSAGMNNIAEKEYSEEILDRADKELRGAGLDELCRFALAEEGKHVPPTRREVINRAFSTVTLPTVLGNIANKSLMSGYKYAPQTWEKWCFTGEVADFKTNTMAVYSDTGGLEKLGDGGKIASGGGTEQSEQYRIYTYAKNFAVTREQFINDDLNVFTSEPFRMGRASQNNISNLVYTALLANGTLGADGYDLCGTDHDNYISGTDSVLNDTYGVDAVSSALEKFLTMTDLGGNYLNVMPKYLLIPPELLSFAQNLYQSPQLVGISSKKAPSNNIHAGKFEVICDPRLSASSYTGYSSTAWYMLADPMDVQTMGVFFLRGQRNPTIERVDVDPDTLGFKWRVYHDVGVKAVDYRGIVKSAGA